MFLVHLACISGRFVHSCSQPFPFELLFARTVMDSLSSSASTVPGFRQLHVVRALKHERPSLQQLAKWRNLPRGVHRGFHVAVRRILVFFEGLLLFFLLSCPRVVCSMSPVFRPDTASIRSCLLLPPGFFDTREAVFLLFSLLDWFCM